MKEGQGVKLTTRIASYLLVAYLSAGALMAALTYPYMVQARKPVAWRVGAVTQIVTTWPRFVPHTARAALEQPQ